MQLASLKAFVRNIVASWATIPTATANYSSTYKVEMTANYCLLLVAAGVLSAKHTLGGYSVDIEKAAWQVSVQLNGVHYCGGAIYSEQIVITAAHCLYEEVFGERPRFLDWTRIMVYAGTNIKRFTGLYSDVLRLIPHKLYDNKGKNSNHTCVYDIGVIKLRLKLPSSRQVRTIRLAEKEPAPKTSVSFTGWGYKLANYHREVAISAIHNFIYPEVLQSITAIIESHEMCKRYFPAKLDGTICAETKIDYPCLGDDGGPLVYDNTLVGVFIGRDTERCDRAFYASVAFHKTWLRDTAKSISTM